MPENLKKLTDQMKTDLSARIADKSFSDLLSKTKAASDSDSGTFEVIVSTADRDRQGEIVNQNGWDLTFYKMNPIVLWAHDYSMLPIGVCTSIEVVAGRLIAKGKFAPEDCNPFAQQVRRLYDGGFVKTTSVGFIPREFSPNNNDEITKAELLEFSFVPVPANPYALTMRQIKDLKIDTALMMTKGINLDVKEEAPAPAPEPAPAPAPAPEAPKEEPSAPAPEAPAPAPAAEVPPADKTVDEKAGRSISKKNADAINEVCDCLEQSAATLRALANASNGADEDDQDGKAAEVPAEGAGKPDEKDQELNEFLFVRTLMKDLDKVVGAGLETFNKHVRDRSVIIKKAK